MRKTLAQLAHAVADTWPYEIFISSGADNLTVVWAAPPRVAKVRTGDAGLKKIKAAEALRASASPREVLS